MSADEGSRTGRLECGVELRWEFHVPIGSGLDEDVSILVKDCEDPGEAAEKAREFIEWLRSFPEPPELVFSQE